MCRWAWQDGLLKSVVDLCDEGEADGQGNQDVDVNRGDDTAEKREDVDEQREKGKCRGRESV